MEILSNPELIRNARAQLRPGRMIAVGGICLVISLTMAYAFWEGDGSKSNEWARNLLLTALGTQVFVLAVGGSLACLQSVSREKELNTFDYQRVTRLTPLELAIGKLLGAPVLAYFITLCFLPLVLFAAVFGGTRPSFLVAALAVMIFGSIVLHAMSLVVSMLLPRGLSIGGALILIYFLGIGSIPDFGAIAIGRPSPFFALDLVQLTSWTETKLDSARLVDEFFGWKIHHFWMLMLLYSSFTAWFLAGLARNLKRDPSTYELYSPKQSFLFALFINFLFIGFFRWETEPPLQSHGLVLALNIVLFFGLGLALLLNRDQARRRLRTGGEAATGWLAAAWPAPYLVAGIAVTGVLAALLYSTVSEKHPWNWGMVLFVIAFVAAGLSRDVLYLQWINLTRIKRPLVMGFVYLMVYYVCIIILLSVAGAGPSSAWLWAMFVPNGVLGLEPKAWSNNALPWMVSLAVQAALCGLFVYLQKKKLEEMSAPKAAAPASSGAPQVSSLSSP